MATINQIEFILSIKDKIKEPILILGSKIYNYDSYNIEKKLNELGYFDITGIDLDSGEGVDIIADIMDLELPFFKEKVGYYNTVFCMELLTHVSKPWLVGENINKLTNKDGHVIMSECFVRKFTHMPGDFWRFTYDSFKIICSDFDFIDELAMKSLTRAKKPDLKPFDNEIFEIIHGIADDESVCGFFLRKIHRKFFGGKLFKVSRILPEQTFYAIGKKR